MAERNPATAGPPSLWSRLMSPFRERGEMLAGFNYNSPTASGVADVLMQANQAMPWGGNDPSAIGINPAEGSIDPSVMVPWATNMAGMAQAGTIAGPAVPGAVGQGMRTTLYHGSPVEGLTRLAKSDRGPLGPGVYTSPAKQISEAYARGDGTVYELPAKERDIYLGHGHRTDDEWFGFKEDQKRLIEAAEPENRPKIEAILSKMWSSDGYPTYQRIARDVYGSDAGAQELFRRAGFQGVSGQVDGPEVLLFDEQRLTPEHSLRDTLLRSARPAP